MFVKPIFYAYAQTEERLIIFYQLNVHVFNLDKNLNQFHQTDILK